MTLQILRGISGSPGYSSGRSIHVNCADDTSGKIIVAKAFTPDHTYLLYNSAGLVTEEGSILSHPAIVSREINKPCLIGVKNAFKLIEDNKAVKLCAPSRLGDHGLVYVIDADKERLFEFLALASNRQVYGNKTSNLAELIQHGFNVPKGIVLSHELRTSRDLFEVIEGAKLYFDGEIIARPSSLMEDSTLSFAGIYKSIRSKLSDLYVTVNRCWDSLDQVNSQRYQEAHRIKTLDKLSILIQEYVFREFSGFVLTQDPTDKTRGLIEVTDHPYEDVNSGKINPERIFFSRKDRTSADSELIGAELVLKLISTSLRIEELFNYPQLIEFGIKDNQLLIFQSRQVT